MDGFSWPIDGPAWPIDGLLWVMDGRMWAMDGRDKTSDKVARRRAFRRPAIFVVGDRRFFVGDRRPRQKSRQTREQPRRPSPEFLSWVIDGRADKIIPPREPRRRAKLAANTEKTAVSSASTRVLEKMARALFARRGATKIRSKGALILFMALPRRSRRIAIPGLPS